MIVIGCTCGGTIFTDSMCKPCLKVAEEKLLAKIEYHEDKISDLESDLEQVQWCLYEEEQEEEDGAEEEEEPA